MKKKTILAPAPKKAGKNPVAPKAIAIEKKTAKSGVQPKTRKKVCASPVCKCGDKPTKTSAVKANPAWKKRFDGQFQTPSNPAKKPAAKPVVVAKKPAVAAKPEIPGGWTPKEIAMLKKLAPKRKTWVAVAAAMGRTADSVRCKARSLGIG